METYVIHTTKKCNADCLYCYEQDKTSLYTWPEIERVLEELLRKNKESAFTIEFLGGEPMMEPAFIQKAYEYLEARAPNTVASYCITTNGTLLDADTISFLQRAPKVQWATSMDGTKYMNSLRIFRDTHKNTYDVAVMNLKTLLKAIGPDRIFVHMVIHPYNVSLLSNGIRHLYGLGIRHIGVGTVESTVKIGREYCETFVREMGIISQAMAAGAHEGLTCDLFSGIKPRSDTRYYMFDEEGKLIAESYGRANGGLVDSDKLRAVPTSSSVSEMIYDIRETVYNNHQQIQNKGEK